MPSSVISGYNTGFLSEVGQIYDVNGWPSMVISTRRSAAFGTTRTPWATPETAAQPSASSPAPIPSAQRTRASRIRLASHHYLLAGVVKRDLLPGLDSRHVHTQGNGVAVARLDGRV